MHRLTSWQVVLQSQVIHPNWTATDHVAYLESEHDGTADLYGGSPAEVVQRWLDENNAWTGGPAARANIGCIGCFKNDGGHYRGCPTGQNGAPNYD